MKKYFSLLLMGMLLLSSCNEKKSNSEFGKTTEAQATTQMSVDDLLADAEKLVGQNVSVEGVCTHICAHGGKKIFLMGSDDTKYLRVEAGEEIGSFKQESVNSLVEVKGVLTEERIDEAYLAQWETQLAEENAEAHEEGGCTADQKANNEKKADSTAERIANMRAQIVERQAKEGKAYLSFYYLLGETYEIK